MTPHKHHDLIVAWAKGAQIQFEDNGTWYACAQHPLWTPSTRYRIKPEPKPDVVLLKHVNRYGHVYVVRAAHEHPNLQLTIDGETGKLKKAEVIDEA